MKPCFVFSVALLFFSNAQAHTPNVFISEITETEQGWALNLHFSTHGILEVLQVDSLSIGKDISLEELELAITDYLKNQVQIVINKAQNAEIYNPKINLGSHAIEVSFSIQTPEKPTFWDIELPLLPELNNGMYPLRTQSSGQVKTFALSAKNKMKINLLRTSKYGFRQIP